MSKSLTPSYGFDVFGYEFPGGDILRVTLHDHLGHMYVVPRTSSRDFMKHFARTDQLLRAKGIYFLTGDTPQGRMVYVGQVGGGTFQARLQQHVRGKSWWSTAYLVADATQWSREIVDYMEALSIQTARTNTSYVTENGTNGAAVMDDLNTRGRAEQALNGVRSLSLVQIN